MKKFYCIILMLVASYFSFAQNVGIGTTTPNASAQLDISSTTKGVLVPRMTSLQRLAIASPVKGLLVFDTDNNSFWFYNGSAWSNIPASNEFISQNGMVHNTTNMATDNFVFGSVKMDDTTGTADNNRFYFNKAKGAFRAGRVTTNNWNNDSVGIYSFAAGTDSKAKGDNATAIGEGTSASGHSSTALGAITNASGWVSTALGGETKAQANYSTALGYRSNASGDYSTAIGNSTTASGNSSTAMGNGTTASGSGSTAMGGLTTASGSFSFATGVFSTASGNTSTAIGVANASGDYSAAIGIGVNAPSYGETSIGLNNTAYTLATNGATTFNAADRLFSIGNGTADNARSNALTIFKNGNTGIGTDNPTSKLDVNGQIIIEQKNFGGYGGLLIKGNVPGSNYPNIGFSVKNTSNSDVIAASVTGELIANTLGAEAIDLVLATSKNGQSGLSEKLRIKSNGALAVSGNTGTAGQVLTSTGSTSAPTWTDLPLKPYAFQFNQIGSVYLTGSVTSAVIPGLDNRQFTINQPSDIVLNFCGEVLSSTAFAFPNGEVEIQIYNAALERVLFTRVMFKADFYHTISRSSMLANLPAGTYTVYTTFSRFNTIDGEFSMFWTTGGQYAEPTKLIFQVFPK